MHIAWLIPTVGVFGAVREMVEMSNALISRRHQVTIYHPDGGPCEWLTFRGTCKRVTALATDRPDVLISLSDWQRNMHAALDAAVAKVKIITVVGFDPGPDIEAVWTGRKPARDVGEDLQKLSIHKYHVLTDSSWQRDWLKAHVGVDSLPPFGGISLAQFHPQPQTHAKGYMLVGATADPRARKGTKTVMAAYKLIQEAKLPVRMATYWGKNLSQPELAKWYANCDLFLDAERRAGWANPVAEAMACDVACVSTDIGAVHDFAINGQTAYLTPIDDAKAMADAAISLLRNDKLRRQFAAAGLERVKLFSYDKMAIPLEAELQRLVNA